MGKPKDGGLTPRQKLFVEIYLANRFNGTRAYMAAFDCKSPKVASVQATRLLANTSIVKELNKSTTALQRKMKLSQERVLRELMLIGFADPKEYMKWEGDTNVLLPSDSLPRGKSRAIKSVKSTWSKDGGSISMEFHDKLGALKTLEKITKLTGADTDEPNKPDRSREDGGEEISGNVVDRILGAAEGDEKK